MVQEWRPPRVQYELLQIDGIAEEGNRWKGRRVGEASQPKFHVYINFEGTEEWEWSGIDFRESLDVRPAVLYEVEVPDFLSVRREQFYGADRASGVGDYIQWSPFRAFEEIFNVDLALWKEHKGPQRGILKEGPTPMTTHITGTETVFLGMEMGGNEAKDIQGNAVDVNEGVPPFTDVCQRGRNILVELRNVVEGETVEEVSASPRERVRNEVSQRTTENRPCASAPCSEQKRAEKATDPFQGKYTRPLRGGRVGD